MARHEQDRDDLYAELRSASPRWELEIPHRTVPVVAGIRSDNRFSLYLHPDECYHYDAENRLRRAFVDDFLFRSQGTTLSRLRRNRTGDSVHLLRQDLSEPQLQEFLTRMRSALHTLLQQLNHGEHQVLRSAPDANASISVLAQRLSGAISAQPPLSDPLCSR